MARQIWLRQTQDERNNKWNRVNNQPLLSRNFKVLNSIETYRIANAKLFWATNFAVLKRK
ncbi:MAG: hypothetical protein CTY19_11970 [Methylomonas sp.]|nr:MAG: hypothetical protein CTY19_11970 [Methylomonas sp.]